MTAVESNGHHDARELVEMYRGHANPAEMGRRFLSYRKEHGVSQQGLARLTGITPGTVHHFESLLTLAPELIRAVESGALTFKEARSLADLSPHARQIEIADPFLDGALSSVWVEAVVRIARAKPKATREEVLELVMAHAKVKSAPLPPPPKPLRACADEVQRMMLDLAAKLTPLAATPYPEITTMRLRQTARILTDRLKAAKLT